MTFKSRAEKVILSLMSSPSLKTSLLLVELLSLLSLKSLSSQLLAAKMQKLCGKALAITSLDTKAIYLSYITSSILQRLFKTPRAHSTTTPAEANSLLNLIPGGSLVPSGYGFCSQGESGYILSPTRQGCISSGPIRCIGAAAKISPLPAF